MKLNGLNISDRLITNYIKHFSKDRLTIRDWETERQKLHNAIFESVNLNRFSGEGKKLSDALDKHCIPFIEKADYFVAGLKKIGIAKNEGEIKQAELDLQNRRMFEELQKRKRNEPSIYSENTCRVCNKDLDEVGCPRVNDHLLGNALNAEPVDRAICMKCADNNPDEHFSEFRERYWNH